jgi:hypothetical protein
MTMRKLHILAAFAPCLISVCLAQSPQEPAFIRWRTVDETSSLSDKLRRSNMEFLTRHGLSGSIVAHGKDESLVLAGPFTSRQAFEAALEMLKGWGDVESEAPYYLQSEATGPVSAPGTSQGGGRPGQPAPQDGGGLPSDSQKQRRKQIADWLNQEVKEAGGVLRCIAIEPTGVSSDILGSFHSLEFAQDGAVIGRGYYDDVNVVRWQEVRSVDIVNDGSIDIWTTIHIKRLDNPGNPMQPNGGFLGSSWEEVSSRPVHVRFWLATNNPQRNVQFVSALRSVVAASQ